MAGYQNYSPNQPRQIVYVTAGNFGTTLGGVVDSSILYVVDGTVDCAGVSIEVPAGGLFLAGHNLDLSRIICGGAAFTLFTSPVGGSGNVFMRDLNLEISGAGSQVFDLVDSNGFHAIELSRVNFTDCASLGTLDNYRQGLENGNGRFGGTPNLILKGVWVGGYRVTTTIVRGLVDGVYALFEAGAGFTMASRFLTDLNVDLPASVALLDFAPSNFLNASTLQLHGVLLTRSGVANPDDANLTPNISAADLASDWRDNIGLANTFEGGRLSVTGEIATSVSVAGVFYDLAGTWGADNLEHFDSPGSGQLRALASSPREFMLVVNLVLDAGANDQLALRVRRWDNSAAAFIDSAARVRQVNNLSGARDVAIFNYMIPVVIDKDDYIILQIANNSGTANITAELDSAWFLAQR